MDTQEVKPVMTEEYREKLHEQILFCKDKEKLSKLAQEYYGVTEKRAKEIAEELFMGWK